MRILRGLTSRLLPCGCVAGVYETYDGLVTTLLDEREVTCQDPNHADGNEIPELLRQAGKSSKVGLHPDRQRKP
ncbi:MAG TPA: hypothetical protein VF921_00015 [Vicinamibacterales bacterium]